MATDKQKIHLQRLGHSGYALPAGRPDIRDWEVKDGQGRRVGYVDEILLEVNTGRYRYLILYVPSDPVHTKERKVIVPIGLAELHHDDDDVLLPGVSGEQLRALPAFTGRVAEEDKICLVLNCCRKPDARPGSASFYAQSCFGEERMFRSRERSTHSFDEDDDRTDTLAASNPRGPSPRD